jgi:hypothetical protein
MMARWVCELMVAALLGAQTALLIEVVRMDRQVASIEANVQAIARDVAPH